MALLLTTSAFATRTFTICGEKDDRRPSFVKQVGRAVKPGAQVGCTLTLIGRSCAISAGHCFNDLKIAQFNTYHNKAGILLSKPEDTYYIDDLSVLSQNSGHGKDWSVFKILPNEMTKRYPGDRQGYLKTNMNKFQRHGSSVTITGYGWLSYTENKNGPQQTHTSTLLISKGSEFYYDVDTMGGNSGSSVVNEDNEILGVHTHGYCSEDGGANQGTLISRHESFKTAIQDCLKWEKGLVSEI
jgi:V8-like Glu-specific endopeptidase